MYSSKPLNDMDFLQQLQSNYTVKYINHSKHNVHSLISGLTFCEAPDYVCGLHYVERFSIDAYERVSIKPGKSTSLHLADEKAMEKRAETPQDSFYTVRYQTPNSLTNTRHLKKNMMDMIAQKTEKISSYNAECPDVRYRHLLIELNGSCHIYADVQGKFFSSVVPIDNLHTVKYQIYRDDTFVKDLMYRYASHWDLLLFVNYYGNLSDEMYTVYCIDLKQDIIKEKMIDYPEVLFQIKEGRIVCHTLDCGKEINNIVYSCEDDIGKRQLFAKQPPHIMINGICFTRDKIHDSIYSAKQYALFFALSQLAFSICEDDSIKRAECKLFLQETLILGFDDKQIVLTKNGTTDGCTLNIFI